ncbi:MAG: hypothetical protein R3E98_08090 [Gemmatimonadota bacterium]|nr:hypothetical protein [Gemmatimonadota bacterium]
MELSSWSPTCDGRAALLLACLSACAPGGERPDARADVAEWRVASEPLLTVGAVDGPSETLLSRVADARLLPDGGVAVADGGSSSIRIFDADGRLRTTRGRAGEGPGEFASLSALHLYSPDTLVAWDSRLSRLTLFPPDPGAPVVTTPVHAPGGSAELWLGRFGDGSGAVGWIRQGPRGPDAVSADRMDLGRVAIGLGQISVLAPTQGIRRVAFQRPGGARTSMPLPFSPHLVGAVSGDALYFTDGVGPALEVVGSDGGRRGPLVHGLTGPPVAEALARLAAELPETGDRGALTTDDLDAVAAVTPLDPIPAVSALFSDDQGRLWLKAYDPVADSHWLGRSLAGGTWWIARRTGGMLARVQVPDGFRPMDVRGSRVAGLVRDTLGVERVEVRALLAP